MKLEHGHAAWTGTYRVEMDMQHRHGHADWTRAYSLDMGIDMDNYMDINYYWKTINEPSRRRFYC
jgi:hypothetical protein